MRMVRRLELLQDVFAGEKQTLFLLPGTGLLGREPFSWRGSRGGFRLLLLDCLTLPAARHSSDYIRPNPSFKLAGGESGSSLKHEEIQGDIAKSGVRESASESKNLFAVGSNSFYHRGSPGGTGRDANNGYGAMSFR